MLVKRREVFANLLDLGEKLMPTNYLILITLSIVIGLLIIIIIELGRIKMTQAEAHDQIASAVSQLNDAVNAAAQRVILAQANPEQIVPIDDLLSGLTNATNTANQIAPEVIP